MGPGVTGKLIVLFIYLLLVIFLLERRTLN